MSRQQIIHILGASGAGTSTLGQVFEREYGFKWLDTDGFFWQQDDPPFTNILPREERVKLLGTAIEEHPKCVISGSLCGWGDIFIPKFDLVVFVDTPTDIRIERLRNRETERFGERIREGGDMFENHCNFLEWAAKYDDGGMDMRSRALHEDWLKNCPCPVIRVDGTSDCGQTASDIIEHFYTMPGESWRVKAYPIGELEKYRFTVIFARHNDKWLYARHKERDTYETAGGHIEPGETAIECAKRELFEETGATKFSIYPAFDYAVHRDTEFSYGQVYYADVQELGNIPDYEMAEVMYFDTIPDKMRFPQILPILYEKMQAWLNLQSAKDEKWDVYDSKRNFKGRTHRRADPLPEGDYHLVVHVWLRNSKGEFLITKRAPNKGYPNMWECTGGSAVTGDDSITAAIREVKEEIGLDAAPENGVCMFTITRDDSICDIWLFQQDFDVRDVILQENETIDSKYASEDEILRMIENGEFIAFHYIEDLFNKIKGVNQ